MCNLRPLESNLIVKRHDVKDVTDGGIVLPDSAKEKPKFGSVLAVGPGRADGGVRVPMGLVVGDTVIFGAYSGTEVVHGNTTYIIMDVSDVLAVVGGTR